MQKSKLLFLLILTFINCGNEIDSENCIPYFSLNINKDLNSPEMNKVLTPGFVKISGGNKGILLINVNGSDFVAYDRVCPANDCSNPMSFENGLTLKCACDNSEYAVGKGIGGAPQTEGFTCPAIEYRVIKSGTRIIITNF